MPAIFVRIFIKNEQEDSKNALPQRLGYICCALVAHQSFLLRLRNRYRKDIKRMSFISPLKKVSLYKIFSFSISPKWAAEPKRMMDLSEGR